MGGAMTNLLMLVLWVVFGPVMLLHKLFWFGRYAVYCKQGRQDSTYVVSNAIYLLINAAITFAPVIFKMTD